MTQDQAFDILTMGMNVFLTGPAGTGKTFLVNRFITHCHEHGISVAITASTGIAATHIGGMTIHSWSGLGIRESVDEEMIDSIISASYLKKRYRETQVLIIDEISMLSGDFLDSLSRLLQRARGDGAPFGGIQVVLVGDFFQLPPVSSGRASSFAFEHPGWRSFALAICALSRSYRQIDDPLLDILGEIRSGEVSQSSIDLLLARRVEIQTTDHTELFTHNVAVDQYNLSRLNQIQDTTFVSEMITQGPEKLTTTLKKGCLAPETLVLKVGARVMFVKNNFDAGYVNGSIGTIIGKKDIYPIVRLLSGEEILALPMSWEIEEDGRVKASIHQVPLRLAWAITVHKSQGMTLDSAVMDLGDAFVAGQGYVALSRVRSLSGLILRRISSTALEIDPRVLRYDQTIQASSDRVVARLAEFSQQDLTTRKSTAILRLGGTIETQTRVVHGITPPREKKIATHMETKTLIEQGMTIEAIALARDLKPSTIMDHIDRLRVMDQLPDITHLRPADESRLTRILSTFEQLHTTSLTPVREILGDDYGYDELRFARLFLREEVREGEDLPF